MDVRTRDLLVSFLDLYLTDAAGGNIYGTICRCLEEMSLKDCSDKTDYDYWCVFADKKVVLYGREVTDKSIEIKFDRKLNINGRNRRITFIRYCSSPCQYSGDCRAKMESDLGKIISVDLSILFNTENKKNHISGITTGEKTVDPSDQEYAILKLDEAALHWYSTSREYNALEVLSKHFCLSTFKVLFQVYDPHESKYAYRGLVKYKDKLEYKIPIIFNSNSKADIDQWEKESQTGKASPNGAKLIPQLLSSRQPIIMHEQSFSATLNELRNSKKKVKKLDKYEVSLLEDGENHYFMIPLFCNGQSRGTCAIFWTIDKADNHQLFIYFMKRLWSSIGHEASQWFEQAYEEIFEARLEDYVHKLNESNAYNIMQGLLAHINCVLNCSDGYVHRVMANWTPIEHFNRKGIDKKERAWHSVALSPDEKTTDFKKSCKHRESINCELIDENTKINLHFCHDKKLKIFITFEKEKFILDLRCPDLAPHVFNSYAGVLTNRLRETIHRVEEIRKLHRARRKMAAAAIMSRNGSHNIGSHVLAALTHAIDVRPPDRRFFSYIQHRMDYLATITTDWPVWAPGARFSDEIMCDFKAQTRLLNNICASEGITGEKIEFTAKVKKLGSKGYSETEDLYVPVPGGMVGRHAFYTVFENIMRNAAKHAFSKVRTTDKKLDITVLLEEMDESIKFIIFDNVSKVNIKKKNKENDELLLPKNLASIKEDEDTTNWPLHQQLNHILERPLIDENDILRKEGWGLAEMQLSTAYLKREHYNNHLPTKLNSPITAHPYTHGKETFLSYEFSLPKVKDILVVGLGEPTDPSTFSSQGIDFRDDTPAICDYSFVVLSLEAFNHMEQEHKKLYGNNKELPLPYRRIIVVPDKVSCEYGCQITHDQFKSYISDAPSLKSNIYKSWLDYLRKIRGFDKPIKMRISADSEAAPPEDAGQRNELYKFVWNNYMPNILKEAPGVVFSDEDNKCLLANGAHPLLEKTTLPLSVDNWLKKLKTLSDDQRSKITLHVVSSIKAIKFLLFDDTSPRHAGKSVIGSSNAALLGLQVVREGSNKFSYIHHGERAPSQSQYFESLSGSQSYFSQLHPQGSDYDLKILFYLAENALLRVLIVDERVTQYVETHGDMKEKFMNMKICVPEAVKYTNEDAKFLSLCREDAKARNSGILLASNNSDHDILIIHVGVMEKLTGAKKQSEFQDYLYKLRKFYKYVIVVTGRGKPTILPDKEKYLPFTEIEARLFKKSPEKMPLIVSIMEALPHGEE